MPVDEDDIRRWIVVVVVVKTMEGGGGEPDDEKQASVGLESSGRFGALDDKIADKVERAEDAFSTPSRTFKVVQEELFVSKIPPPPEKQQWVAATTTTQRFNELIILLLLCSTYF